MEFTLAADAISTIKPANIGTVPQICAPPLCPALDYACSLYTSSVLAASSPEAKIVTDANSRQQRLLSSSSCMLIFLC